MNYEKLKQLKNWLDQAEVDLAYLSDPSHIAYFTGFHSDPHERILGLFVFNQQEDFLFTPALEVNSAQNSSWNGEVIGYLDEEDPWEKITQAIKKRLKKDNFSLAIEKNYLSVARLEKLASKFNNFGKVVDLTELIQRMQLIKTADEIKLLQAAGAKADLALEIGFNAVQVGVSEAEIVAEIEYQLKKQGVKEMSFATIVLAGAGAADPHGEPGNTKIADHNLVLFDLGCVWQGYTSDVTRTIAVGAPSDFDRKIYEIVLEAQQTALDFVKPNVTAAEIDQVARSVITKAGYGEYFNHRLGHGIGTTVHEYPSIVAGNDLVIEEGMCFSIEPGIYLPEKVGVRIEDCIQVTATGCESFTKTDKKLKIIG